MQQWVPFAQLTYKNISSYSQQYKKAFSSSSASKNEYQENSWG
jgi:hypothetical protein